LLLILAINGGLKLVRIGNYWRGVLSAVVPLGAYVAYASAHWPGGDVVTVHVTVYLATAAVLTIIGMGQGSKEENQRKGLHWAPMVLVSFFAGLATLMAIFMMISVRGLPPSVASLVMPKAEGKKIHTAFAGVVEHDQEAAKTISQHMQQQEKQKRLGWVIGIQGLEKDKLKKGQPLAVEVSVRDGASRPIGQGKVSVVIQQLANAENEQVIVLNESRPGYYTGTVGFDHPGHWIVDFLVEREGASYRVEQSIIVPNA
jgi:nitrogen fixation protein FixH